MKPPEGKRVYVTGAAQGLGLAIAARFLEDGARVVMTDVDGDALDAAARDLGDDAHAVRADVTDSSSVRESLDRAAELLGGLDVVVNNAGIEIAKPLVEHSDEEVERILAINVHGVFSGIKHAVPHLSGEGGVIVNMASVAGLGGAPLLGLYCASKAAVLRMTEVAATELRDQGIRVCAVCPAFADTKMVERLIPPFEAATGLDFDQVIALKQGRLGTPADVAEAVAFLASDEASWITGQPLVLDGGLTGSLL